MDIFGKKDKTTSAILIEKALERLEDKYEEKQLDLFEYQAAQLPKIKIPGKLRTRQEVSTKPIPGVDISGSGYVIQSPQDAATLLSHLVVEKHEPLVSGKVSSQLKNKIGVQVK